MEKADIEAAAQMFVAARTSLGLIWALPARSSPNTAAEAYAIQLETVARLADRVAGWKVALSEEYEVLYGALLGSRFFESGATINSGDMSMVGVEAEIAFRFDAPVPPREREYTAEDIAATVTAFPALEILDTRFRDYDGTSPIDRAADFMSNSAFVSGAPREDWRRFDLSTLEVRLLIDGREIVHTIGGHAAIDPLRPAVALANMLRHSTGIKAGRIMTTGTYTGLKFVSKSCAVEANFTNFGGVACRFGAD